MKRTKKIILGGIAGLIALLVIVTVILHFISNRTVHFPLPDYWPTYGWQPSTPEEQGLDSEKLAEGLLAIQQKNIPIHSLMIVRNGYVVLGASFYPYDGQSPHNLGSVTKSVLTTLVGIAVDQGKLNLDDTMVSFFPEYAIANRDSRKNKITVRDLLIMASGLDCVGLPREATVQEMEASPDWVQFMLDRPMVDEPGNTFVYCGGNMHLLSAILQQATGMTALEFARQNLFEPLGFQEVVWPADPQGFNQGSGNIRMVPADMAKLGFLFLQRGQWDGKQIISRQWVHNAVKAQIGSTYGYGWWINDGAAGREFNADGAGGQHIAVIPGLSIVLITTGGGFNVDEVVSFLSPALVDMKFPLPANPAGVTNLNAVLQEISETPLPKPPAILPEKATQVSGMTVEFENNLLQLQSLRLEFKDSFEADVQFTFSDGSQSPIAGIGLDGVYRMTPDVGLDRAIRTKAETVGLTVGMRGNWVDPQSLVIEYDTITNRYAYLLEIHFESDGVTVIASDRIYGNSITLHGNLHNP
jgi:CubicO group peptidase (beta-lactamase class C family)